MEYSEFLKKKIVRLQDSGFVVESLNPMLFDFQKDIVKWALRKGRSAIFADCGLGKTPMQLEWAKHVHEYTKGDVLILAPLAVSQQTVREGEKFGISVNICRSRDDWKKGINITNYEKLDKFDTTWPVGIVLDECFSPDTPIDVFNIDNVLKSLYIKDVQKGMKIFNAQGKDYVQSTHKRQINRAIQITANGNRITCSENHPYFTMYGWKCSQDLQPGDYIMATDAAMRLVRKNISPEILGDEDAEILRSILLSEMEDEPGRYKGKGPQPGSSSKTRQEQKCVVSEQQSEGNKGKEKDIISQPNEQPGNTKESFVYIAKNASQTFRAWWKWSWLNHSSKDTTRCSWKRLENGVFFVVGKTCSWLSNRLQIRFSKYSQKNKYRGRWKEPLQPEKSRPKERQKTEFVRVDSVEVLEQGHPKLEKYRDADGHIYFYDIKSTRHPSFSVMGLLVHNSSILKSYSGATRNQIIEAFRDTNYKLACTATPSPNDYMELGNHAEFLNVMSRTEMLSMYFIHDGGDTAKWRLKGHVKDNLFWRWICQWAVMMTKPSDLGYDDGGFNLPELRFNEHFVKSSPKEGMLFVTEATDLMDRRRARRDSLQERVQRATSLIDPESQWLCWCDLNSESHMLSKGIDNAVEVKGGDKIEHKENSMIGFSEGKIHCMVTKPSIAGFGMNFQNCHNMIFVGLSDSYESMYQAIRRCWRFGQEKPVNVHIVLSDREGSVLRNIKRKERDHETMVENMVKNMSDLTKIELHKEKKIVAKYEIKKHEGNGWTLYHGDCVDVARQTPENSIDYTIFSPPFASLYTYSDSNRDMGNSKTDQEFAIHFGYLIGEMFHTTRPGRLVSIHCMDIPAMKERDGYIGLKDFSGELIRTMQKGGFVYHSRCTIWKDPLIEATRTKSLGLMHKQIQKDSSRCRQGLPDYIVTFMKPGENDRPIAHPDGFTRFIGVDEPTQSGIQYSHNVWRRYASPVWMDIRQTHTLNKALARDDKDERHIAPLQLDVIARCIELWSLEGDLVCSWFAGIGSEGYQSLRMKRKFIGSELKDSYVKVAINNLRDATNEKQQALF